MSCNKSQWEGSNCKIYNCHYGCSLSLTAKISRRRQGSLAGDVSIETKMLRGNDFTNNHKGNYMFYYDRCYIIHNPICLCLISELVHNAFKRVYYHHII